MWGGLIVARRNLRCPVLVDAIQRLGDREIQHAHQLHKLRKECQGKALHVETLSSLDLPCNQLSRASVRSQIGSKPNFLFLSFPLNASEFSSFPSGILEIV